MLNCSGEVAVLGIFSHRAKAPCDPDHSTLVFFFVFILLRPYMKCNCHLSLNSDRKDFSHIFYKFSSNTHHWTLLFLKFIHNMELNAVRIIACLRKSENSVERFPFVMSLKILRGWHKLSAMLL